MTTMTRMVPWQKKCTLDGRYRFDIELLTECVFPRRPLRLHCRRLLGAWSPKLFRFPMLVVPRLDPEKIQQSQTVVELWDR